MINKGTVKWFNEARGFGYIGGDDGQDVFCHHTSIQMDGFRCLTEGQTVTYEVENNERGPRAVNVFVIND